MIKCYIYSSHLIKAQFYFLFFLIQKLQNCCKIAQSKSTKQYYCVCVRACIGVFQHVCVCVGGGWGACMHVCVCRHTGMDVITACTNVSTCVILVSAQSVCTYISYQHVTCRKPKFPIK